MFASSSKSVVLFFKSAVRPSDSLKTTRRCRMSSYSVFVLTQVIPYYWQIYIPLCTRVHMLNGRSVCRINTYRNNHHILFLSFRRAKSLFFALITIRTWSFFTFILFCGIRMHWVDNLHFLPIHWSNSILNFFIDLSNCSLTRSVPEMYDITVLVYSQMCFLL